MLMSPRGRSCRVVYNNLMLSVKIYSLYLFLYLPLPGWCSPLLMGQAKAKLAFKKSVTTSIEVSRA